MAFPSVPRDYSQKINRKMYRAAMRSIVSELLRQDRLLVTESFGVSAPKTREQRRPEANRPLAQVATDSVGRRACRSARAADVGRSTGDRSLRARVTVPP